MLTSLDKVATVSFSPAPPPCHMEEINYSALAPRRGTRPILSNWSDIGTSEMHGGAFSFGSLWNGLKSIGGTIKNWGSKAWHSNTGAAIRKKLDNTGLHDKIVDAVSTGIHGAVDLTRQEIEKAIERRLEKRPTVEQFEVMQQLPTATADVLHSSEVDVAPPPYSAVVDGKRHREDEELVVASDEPPSYDDIYNDKASPKATSQDLVAIKAPSSISSNLPYLASIGTNRRRGWQHTLNSIVGLGVNQCKRRRCF